MSDHTTAPEGVPKLPEPARHVGAWTEDIPTRHVALPMYSADQIRERDTAWQALCADRVAQAAAVERERIAEHVKRSFFGVSKVVESIRALSAATAPAEPVAPKWRPCLNCGCDSTTGKVTHCFGCPNDIATFKPVAPSDEQP